MPSALIDLTLWRGSKKHSTISRTFSLHFFHALTTSCVLYNRTEQSQGLFICQIKERKAAKCTVQNLTVLLEWPWTPALFLVFNQFDLNWEKSKQTTSFPEAATLHNSLTLSSTHTPFYEFLFHYSFASFWFTCFFFLYFPPGNDKGLFDIDKSSGNITVNGTIDVEKTDFFRITVKVIWIHLKI